MACKHPLIRVQDNRCYNRAKDGHLYHPTLAIENPWHPGAIENTISRRLEYDHFGASHMDFSTDIIPCGKCIGCRLEYSRQWANRGYLESKLWQQNWFLTLTYSDENLPDKESINKDHMTEFMKNFRQHMRDKDIQSEGIRFMGCAEYGDNTKRPHMHIILFNCDLPAESFYKPRIINQEFYYQNEIIEKVWDKGIINISEASWNTIAYTARYVTKKITGKAAEEHYGDKEPEFMRTSRRPGIGYGYYEKYRDKIYERDEIIIYNKNGAIRTKPPIYFDKLYEREFPERMKKIKYQRAKEAYEQASIKDENYSHSRIEQMAIEEQTIADRSKKLLRSFEKPPKNEFKK